MITGACDICNPGARLPLSLPQHGAHCSGCSHPRARYTFFPYICAFRKVCAQLYKLTTKATMVGGPKGEWVDNKS